MSESQRTQYLQIPFICSYKHLLGCVGGTLTMTAISLELWHGPVLFWMLIGYGVGYWLGPQQDPLEIESDIDSKDHTSDTSIQHTHANPKTHMMIVSEILNKTRDRLSAPARNILLDIQSHIQQLDIKFRQQPYLIDEPIMIGQIINDYLPTTINNYLNIPTTHTHINLPQGQNAEELLVEQLCLLETQLQNMLTNLIQTDLDAFALNGDFLKQKFTQDNFFKLAPPQSTSSNEQ